MEEELNHKHQLLARQKKNLRKEELRATGYGPLGIPIELQSSLDMLKELIEELNSEIQALERQNNDVPQVAHLPQPDPVSVESVTTVNRPTLLHTLAWPDGSRLIVLPAQMRGGRALAVAKHPVTNGQYRRFVEETGANEPEGQAYVNRAWVGPFSPWRDTNFRASEKPVVCVSFYEAERYCQWVTHLLSEHLAGLLGKRVPFEPQKYPRATTNLPTPHQWDFAAFGTAFPSRDPRLWQDSSAQIHQDAASPASIDEVGTRTNRFGLSDTLGNIWEWCGDTPIAGGVLGLVGAREHQVRGGGFLDDFFDPSFAPFIDALYLIEGINTRHTDLGFRIAAAIAIVDLPQEVQQQLTSCPQLDR